MDIKDQMIEAEEREGIDPDAAYDHVRESLADGADVKPDREMRAKVAADGMAKERERRGWA